MSTEITSFTVIIAFLAPVNLCEQHGQILGTTKTRITAFTVQHDRHITGSLLKQKPIRDRKWITNRVTELAHRFVK